VRLRFSRAALDKLEDGQVIALPKGKVTANGA
jgi:two-component system nitrogen regulation sensor histidine kinase NtrY